MERRGLVPFRWKSVDPVPFRPPGGSACSLRLGWSCAAGSAVPLEGGGGAAGVAWGSAGRGCSLSRVWVRALRVCGAAFPWRVGGCSLSAG